MRLLIDGALSTSELRHPTRDIDIRGSAHFEINWLKKKIAHLSSERFDSLCMSWMEEGTSFGLALRRSKRPASWATSREVRNRGIFMGRSNHRKGFRRFARLLSSTDGAGEAHSNVDRTYDDSHGRPHQALRHTASFLFDLLDCNLRKLIYYDVTIWRIMGLYDFIINGVKPIFYAGTKEPSSYTVWCNAAIGIILQEVHTDVF